MDNFLKSAKNAVNQVKKEGRGLVRDIQDTVSPPSTMEQIERVVHDFWKDEIQPALKDLKGEVKKEFEEISKAFEEFKKDPKKFTMEAIQDIQADINNFTKSPPIQKLKDFLSSVVELVKSINKPEADRSKAFEHLKETATALKESVLGKDISRTR